MNITFYILTFLFFSTSVALAILFKKLKEKYETVLLDVDDIKNSILADKKSGFYNDNVDLLNNEDTKSGKTGDKYYYTVYVDELDRYTNGMSKIKKKTK